MQIVTEIRSNVQSYTIDDLAFASFILLAGILFNGTMVAVFFFMFLLFPADFKGFNIIRRVRKWEVKL